jgi:hypothetical protein
MMELQTSLTHAALEMVARWSSHVSQQLYEGLRDLLDTMTTDGAMTSQVTWLYMLFACSIILPSAVLTFKYWRRPITLLIRRVFPCTTDQRPGTSQTANQPAAPRVPAMDSGVTNHLGCVETRTENVVDTASHSAAPLRTDAETVSGPAPAAQPEAAERKYFAQPGRFQLRN